MTDPKQTSNEHSGDGSTRDPDEEAVKNRRVDPDASPAETINTNADEDTDAEAGAAETATPPDPKEGNPWANVQDPPEGAVDADDPSSGTDEDDEGAPSHDLTSALEENAKLRDQLLRAMADAENARRRAQREREDAAKFGSAKFAKDLLSVADNLRRALEYAPEHSDDSAVKALIDGVEATEKQLLDIFGQHGMERVDPLDERFDPNLHEAMFEVPGTDKPAGTVVQVVEVGYTMNGRLLRPARVGVAKGEAAA
jgi:molecular chaperone GrpE